MVADRDRLRQMEQSSRNHQLGHLSVVPPSTSRTMTGGYPVQLVGPRSRTCPKCDAKPGERCQRRMGGATPGVPPQTYWAPMKRYHRGR